MGKFNILSVNVILFQGNQKILGSAFRVGIMPILVCLLKNSSEFRTIRWKRNFSSRTDVFLKSQLFSKSTLNLACFDIKFVAVRKILLSVLWQGSLGSSVWKLSLYPALSLSVSQKRQLTMKVRGCSRDDKPAFIEEIQAGNQKVMHKYLKPYNFRLISFKDRKNRSFK